VATTSAADRRSQRFCVALENANDGEAVRVRVTGLVRARVYNSGNVAILVGGELWRVISGRPGSLAVM
jgi:hypothetical protein